MRLKPLLLLCILLCFNSFSADWTKLNYDKSKAPVDNPLKGFMPYMNQGLTNKFPYSMEWFYLMLSDIMDGANSFTFDKSLEVKLAKTASHGKQAVFRIYLDYPNKGHGVPEFLIKNGHKLIPYKNNDADNKGGLSPDYNDENLIKAMEVSIAAMGKKYDGDPRIGFITIGYLGHWGEWHTYPNTKLMAKRDVQLRILKAFFNAFKKTKYHLRYPNKGEMSMPCGFHDDSFAYSTLKEKKKSWHFMAQMEQGKATDTWEKQPIGGEIYPPLQKNIWDKTLPPKAQNFSECVKESHCTWLINNAIFRGKWDTGKKAKALLASKIMGYELYVSTYKVNNGMLTIKIENRGVAPFYYKWSVELIDLDSKAVLKPGWDISSIIHQEPVEYTVKVKGKRFGLRVLNPMKGGHPLHFANETQTKDLLILK
jgi:hypothetical protein